MSSLFIMIGLGAAGVAILIAALWRRGSASAELGSVSHQWIAELRAGEPYDSSR
jgi:predicted ATPase